MVKAIEKYTSQRVDFSELDINKLAEIYRTGSLENLPAEYREYFNMMDFARGISVTGFFKEKVIIKSGIIKLLQKQYGVSDYIARQIYNDSINFFHIREDVKTEAIAELYAEKFDLAASIALRKGDLGDFHKNAKEAAVLRGCYKEKAAEIPKEMLRKSVVLYSTDIQDIGGEQIDLKELDEFIDKLPDIPQIKSKRLKADAGIEKFSIIEQMRMDAEIFEDYAEN